MSFNSLTTFSLSSSFVARSNLFIKLLKFLPLPYSLNSLSSTSSIYSSNMFSFSSFLVLVLVFLFFAFFFHLLMALMFRHFHFHFCLLNFLILMLCQLKIVSNKLLNKFNNSLFLRFLVSLMYLNLF